MLDREKHVGTKSEHSSSSPVQKVTAVSWNYMFSNDVTILTRSEWALEVGHFWGQASATVRQRQMQYAAGHIHL